MLRMGLLIRLVAVAVGLGVMLVLPAGAGAASLVVPTASGPVLGIDTGQDMEWRGIPFAAPPVGNLRFRPPAPVAPWSGVRDASQFASPCIQLDFPSGTFGSEDCLYLNVFAPETATPDSHLAVMVHLHPGSNSGFQPYQDAHAFTARNVVVVTVAYRLGVLGFMGHPALTAEGGGQSGEYGALDQVAALHWVHDNIAAFGGDPNNVTLFGSSAGSFDTVALMASPLAQGLITRAAVQGVSFWALTGKNNTLADSEQFGQFVADEAGCGSAADAAACLRAVPAATLVTDGGPLDIAGPPVGTSVLPESPLKLLSGQPSVPLLAGFDREEDAVFFWGNNGGAFPTPYTKKMFTQDTISLVGPKFAAAARAAYPATSYDSLLWAYITMRTDAVRGCPTRRLANTVAAHAPVWRYLNTHVYEDDPFFAQFRASHVLEEPFLWQADIFGYGHLPTPAEQLLAARMTDYWTNFAKTGDPNGPGLPTWPQYTTASEPTLTLDDQIGQITNYHDAQCALADRIPTPFPAPFDFGHGPAIIPPGFLSGHARALP
jgi:para-nitrobenzyl esterase